LVSFSTYARTSYTLEKLRREPVIMPQKNEPAPMSIAEVLEKISGQDRAFNFDITLELTTPSMRVGSLRVHGKVESVANKRK